MDVFADYHWPGNVRELANIVERLAILYPGTPVSASQVRRMLPAGAVTPPTGAAVLRATHAPGSDPESGGGDHPEANEPPLGLSESLELHERSLIARALAASRGNVAEAARRLKTDRPNLYRRMRRLGFGASSDE
jgi:DNA-binding NtrC family response regulator